MLILTSALKKTETINEMSSQSAVTDYTVWGRVNLPIITTQPDVDNIIGFYSFKYNVDDSPNSLVLPTLRLWRRNGLYYTRGTVSFSIASVADVAVAERYMTEENQADLRIYLTCKHAHGRWRRYARGVQAALTALTGAGALLIDANRDIEAASPSDYEISSLSAFFVDMDLGILRGLTSCAQALRSLALKASIRASALAARRLARRRSRLNSIASSPSSPV
jgi:hypothetical protein